MNVYLATGRYYQNTNHQAFLVACTGTQPFFQIFVWTTVGLSRAPSAPVDIRVFPQGETVRGPSVFKKAVSFCKLSDLVISKKQDPKNRTDVLRLQFYRVACCLEFQECSIAMNHTADVQAIIFERDTIGV